MFYEFNETKIIFPKKDSEILAVDFSKVIIIITLFHRFRVLILTFKLFLKIPYVKNINKVHGVINLNNIYNLRQ